MSKRMIDTELWNDETIIENFTAEDKYFWLYLLTSPHNTVLGVLKNSPALMARDMGLHKDTIVNLLYRFENIHRLIYVDKQTDEIFILNWSKYNWTRSEDFIRTIEKQLGNIKSEYIKCELNNKIADKINKTVLVPSNDGTNTNNNILYINKEEIDKYFDKVWEIYQKHISRVQAKTTFEHKLRGLEKEEAHLIAVKIYRMVENQNKIWQDENDGQGRKQEYMPYFSTWLNDNVEDSPNYKRGRKK